MLDDDGLLFKGDARRTSDIGGVRQEFRKECGLLPYELPGLYMTVLTCSFGLLKLERAVIMETKSLFGKIRVLQKKVSNEQATRNGF